MIGSVSVPSFQELNRLISGLEEDTRVSLQVTFIFSGAIVALL